MKYILACLTLTFISITSSFGQNTDASDHYADAKKIIADLGKIVNPRGIQENFETLLGGLKQWVFVRGQDKDNPVILFVHGGPASPMSPVMWMFQRPIEEYFTVVNYDQRASGKTYATNDTSDLGKTIKIDQYVNDAIELTEFLKQRYHKKKSDSYRS